MRNDIGFETNFVSYVYQGVWKKNPTNFFEIKKKLKNWSFLFPSRANRKWRLTFEYAKGTAVGNCQPSLKVPKETVDIPVLSTCLSVACLVLEIIHT